MVEISKCPEGMVLIPGGKFILGSNNLNLREPMIEKEVDIPNFCIHQHEVTNKEFYNVLLADRLKNGEDSCFSGMPIPKSFSGPLQPRVLVGWAEANYYCRLLGFELPTEAQWEKSAKGRGEQVFDYATDDGTLSPEKIHFNQDVPANVCSYPKNSFGLCDMNGNVSEWVKDIYDLAELKAVFGESFDLQTKVRRGGSYYSNNPVGLSVVGRSMTISGGELDIGFRCVAAPQPFAQDHVTISTQKEEKTLRFFTPNFIGVMWGWKKNDYEPNYEVKGDEFQTMLVSEGPQVYLGTSIVSYYPPVKDPATPSIGLNLGGSIGLSDYTHIRENLRREKHARYSLVEGKTIEAEGKLGVTLGIGQRGTFNFIMEFGGAIVYRMGKENDQLSKVVEFVPQMGITIGGPIGNTDFGIGLLFHNSSYSNESLGVGLLVW